MKISVAMCTYNGSRFLDEQLASVVAQTRLPDELVICDDVSSDDTVAKLQKFARDAPFPVRIFVNEKNLGSTRNFEQAIRLCTGECIALSDQDDIWLPHRLCKTEQAFLSQERVELVFGDAELITEDASRMGQRLWEAGFGFLQRLQFALNRPAQALLKQNPVTGATMAFHPALRDVALPIPEIWVHDGWIALIASFFGNVIALDGPLIQYRKHSSQQLGPGRVGLFKRIELSRETLGSNYGRQAELYKIAHARLSPHAKTPKQRKIIRCIDDKVRHLTARATMPAKKIDRIPVVLREFAALRYALYSRSLLTAVRDLIA